MATPKINENCHHVQNDPCRCKINLEKFHFDILCRFQVIKESLPGGGKSPLPPGEIGLNMLADYLDLTFIIDSGGKLSTRLYDKRDDFDFHIVNFSIPFQQHTIWPFLWCVHFAAHKICTMLLTL